MPDMGSPGYISGYVLVFPATGAAILARIRISAMSLVQSSLCMF